MIRRREKIRRAGLTFESLEARRLLAADTIGVRLEDEVVVTETGIEIITKFPTDVLYGCGMNY